LNLEDAEVVEELFLSAIVEDKLAGAVEGYLHIVVAVEPEGEHR
jgi:hypothetical protein